MQVEISARKNVEQFVEDVGGGDIHIFFTVDPASLGEGALHTYALVREGGSCIVHMPSVSLQEVKQRRFVYIDGVSWNWPIAVQRARKKLGVSDEVVPMEIPGWKQMYDTS